jgi:hypothetical protein
MKSTLSHVPSRSANKRSTMISIKRLCPFFHEGSKFYTGIIHQMLSWSTYDWGCSSRELPGSRFQLIHR